MSYAPHEDFIHPARARSELWRVVVGYALIMAVELGLVYALFAVVSQVIGYDRAFSAFEGVFRSAVTTRDTLLLLASFVFVAAGTAVVTVQLHRRSPLGLFGPPPRLLRDFRRTLRAAILVLGVIWLLAPGGDMLDPNLPFGQWLLLLPLALPAILIQTGAEEMLFRGYLQQQLAARVAHPAVWMGVPSALFAWGHYNPDLMGGNAWVMAAWAATFACAAADLTARTGSLGAAVGLHFANNAAAILVAASPGPASGLSLYLYKQGLSAPMSGVEIAVEFATIGVLWLAARVALRV